MHVPTAWMNTTCKSSIRKLPGLCAQITSFLEVWLKYLYQNATPWVLQGIWQLSVGISLHSGTESAHFQLGTRGTYQLTHANLQNYCYYF